jgi:hypothetical protein
VGDYILSLNASLSDIAAHAVANTRVPPGCFLLQDSALLRVGVSEDHPGLWQLGLPTVWNTHLSGRLI